MPQIAVRVREKKMTQQLTNVKKKEEEARPVCSPGADVEGANPVQMWMLQGYAQSRCGYGRVIPGAHVEGVSPVLVRM